MTLSPFWTRIIMAGLFLLGLGLIVVLAGLGLSAALERTVTYRYFDEALARSPETLSAVTWEDNPDLDRPFSAADRAEAGRAITETWALYAAALTTGDPQFLADGFSGAALQRAETAVAEARRTGLQTRMVVLHQTARPVFHHLDESRALALRFALDTAGNLTDLRLGTDRSVSVMTNESTGWHVFAHELRGIDALPPVGAQRPVPQLAGINYYPAAHPWSGFWPNYDPAITARDFDLIRALGANATRIFLPRTAFLTPDLQKRNLASLADLLELASAKGLRVVPVLFDLRGDYTPNLWADDDALLRAVLPVLAASPAVAYVDLKNNADLDYAGQGKGLVQAWLQAMIADSHQIAPDLPVTVGFATAAAAAEMVDAVDIVTYQDYEDLAGTAERLARMRVLAKTKPVQVTEIGTSSWSLAAGLPSSEAAQSDALQQRLSALGPADGLFVWTLHDFPKPDRAAVGVSPWNSGLQAHFGLIDATGREKLAAAITRQFFQSYLKDPKP
jgi:hypothetical protein